MCQKTRCQKFGKDFIDCPHQCKRSLFGHFERGKDIRNAASERQPLVVKFHDFALAGYKQPGSDCVVVEMARAPSWPTLLWLNLLFLALERLGD